MLFNADLALPAKVKLHYHCRLIGSVAGRSTNLRETLGPTSRQAVIAFEEWSAP